MAAKRRAPARRLAVVKPAARAARRRAPQSVAEAAKSGDPRALLVMTRDRLAKAMDNPDCAARDLAALSRQLGAIGAQIEAIDRLAQQLENEDRPADEPWSEASI